MRFYHTIHQAIMQPKSNRKLHLQPILLQVQFETEAAYCRLPQATRRRLKDTGATRRQQLPARCPLLPMGCGLDGAASSSPW